MTAHEKAPRSPPAQVTVTRATPHVGAIIGGIDISQTIDDGDVVTIRRALADYGVVFFRDQHLTEAQHLAFARRFGEININRFFKAVEGWPMIAEVRKEPDQKRNIGGDWHTDHSYDQVPALGSVLYARIVPPLGGDTLFINMAEVFDSFSPGLQRTLEGLRALHSTRHVFGAERPQVPGSDINDRIGNRDLATQDVVHPVVIRHPDSGRKVLYVNPIFTVGIDGWHPSESKALLDYLYTQATRPEFQYRFRWQPGSLAVWDNRATWHMALNDYHGHRRLMHRITVEGVPLT